MIHLRPILIMLVFFVAGTQGSSAQESQRRLVKLESRVYGWYAIAEPDFDKTIGRRELFKVSGQDQFLKGLAGRLVVIEGSFSEGSLRLPALAPPPVSVSENSQRRSFIFTSISSPTEGGYMLLDPKGLLDERSNNRWKVDLVVEPSSEDEQFTVLEVLSKEQLTWEKAPEQTLDASLSPLLDLTLTQDMLDGLTRLGLSQANLRASYQGLSMGLADLRVLLPDNTLSSEQPWSLQGSIDLSYRESKSLAETAFVVSARPLIEGNVLKLAPDWQNIQVEGQLPFAFVLGGGQLGSYARYLPEKLSLIKLDLITDKMKTEEMLDPGVQANWFLSHPAPGTARLSLSTSQSSLPQTSPVAPGLFRLSLGRSVADRLIKQQASELLDPDSPYRPEPPIEVGKALFIPILVKSIFVKNLEAGYERGALRFDNLVIHVGWQAGPLSGVEPLLRASGFVIPRLAQNGPEKYWSWELKLEDLEVLSDKIPGDKKTLAQEFKPQIEAALGPQLAEKERFSNIVPLSRFSPVPSGSLEITSLKALDSDLTLEGRFQP